MKGHTQILIGVVIWMVSLALVLGALVLSLVEGGFHQPAAPSASEVVEESETSTAPLQEDTPTPTLTHTSPPTPTPTATHSPTPTCAVPTGWVLTSLPAGTDIESLAASFALPVDEILKGNCLSAQEVVSSASLYLPPATVTPTSTEKKRKPTSTQSSSSKCGPPSGWVIYVVRKGDTLYSISQRTGASVSSLQLANCMGSSTTVRAGQNLYVPHLPKPVQPTATKKPAATKKPPKTIIPPPSPIPVTPKPTESSSLLDSPPPAFTSLQTGHGFSKVPQTGIVLALLSLRCL